MSEAPALTLDAFDRRLELYQSRSGYRFNEDALALVHFFRRLRTGQGGRLADFGCGNGVMALWCALEDAALEADGYELQPALAGLARRNAEHNGLAGRVQIREGDLRQHKTLVPPATYDAVIINPPYFPVGGGHPSENQEKNIARHETALTLSDWTAAAAHALKEGGELFAVYPAKRLVALLGALTSSRIEPRALQPVHPSGTSEAVQVLVRAVRSGKPGLSVLPPLDTATLR